MRPRDGAEKISRVLPPPDGRMSVISRLAHRHLVDDRAGKFVVDVDDHRFIGLFAAVRAVAEQHARAGDAELEAFAAQRFDDHARAGVRRGRRLRTPRRPAVSVTRIATLPSASRARRSRMTRLCTLSPSLPANGLSLTAKVMLSVGGSISRAWSGSVICGVPMVFDTVALISPAMATMSPALALSTGTRSSPWKANNLVTRPSSTTLPLTSIARMGSLMLSVPLSIRPVRMRPRKLSRSSKVASILNSPVGVERGRRERGRRWSGTTASGRRRGRRR